MWNRWLNGGVCAGMIAFALCGCSEKQELPERKITVYTGGLEIRTFEDAAETQGVVEAVDRAVVSALIPGRIEQLCAGEGDRVKAGAILFHSDKKTFENRCTLAGEALKMARERLRSRELDVTLAKLKLDKAALDLKRSDELFTAHSVSSAAHENTQLAYRSAQIALDKAQADVRTAQAEVDFAAATHEIAKKRLADSAVAAPYDGIVTAKLRNENEFCDAGTPVLKIENPRRKRIAAVLSSLYLNKVAVGKTLVAVYHAADGRELCRVPVTVLPEVVDPASRTFEFKADLPENLKLPSGSLCRIRVIFEVRSSAALPEEAVLFRDGGRFAIFEFNDGTARELTAETGVTANGYTEILNADALRGRNIIVAGQYFVNDGSPVVRAD